MATIGRLLRRFMPSGNAQVPILSNASPNELHSSLLGELMPGDFSQIERDLTLLGLKDSLAQARGFLGSAPSLRQYPLADLLELMVAAAARFTGILNSWDGVHLDGGGRVSLHVQKKLFDLRVPPSLSPQLTNALKRSALNIAARDHQAVACLPFQDDETHRAFRYWSKASICQALRSLQVTNVNMIGVDLSGGDLRGVRFFGQYQQADFRAANLNGALLSSGFKSNDFSHCDLRNTVLSGHFEACLFKGAKVNAATLKNTRTDLLGAVLSH
ncbi:pentapeptide repeat-containing protein [Pseudomonas gingeri]|uniref:pentapeptide repeat-containing protein n=1 Tax=Pseudomonas gingeri TaxID=117681 RepID=UPI0021087DA1|nr:pentapeptide repeat-containing protein [Pseudomonas gingeri]